MLFCETIKLQPKSGMRSADFTKTTFPITTWPLTMTVPLTKSITKTRWNIVFRSSDKHFPVVSLLGSTFGAELCACFHFCTAVLAEFFGSERLTTFLAELTTA